MPDFTNLSRIYFNRIYQAEVAAGQHLEASQRHTLASLLHYGRHTAFAAKKNISDISNYETFSRRVPIADYAAMRPDVMAMIDGKSNLLAPGRVIRFAQSSGTADGKSKFIPITPRTLQRNHYAGAACSLASYLHFHPDSHLFAGKNFILGGSFANELHTNGKAKVGDLSATLIDRINPMVNLVRIPSKRIALMEKWEEKLPALAQAALKADVRSISGVPSWFLTVLRQILHLAGAENIHQVWPNLEVFFHGGIAFGPYRSQYAAITNGKKMHYWENYNASEGFFGVQAQPGMAPMRLLLTTDTFYEFIPADSTTGATDTDTPALPAWQVEEGKVYALVVTSSNGLWRYPLGDTVRIESREPLTITIAGRTKCYINAFGEEVMVHNTDAALEQACRLTNAEVLNYTAAPVYADNGHRGHHQWVIEFSRPPANLQAFAATLDRALQSLNSDYQAKRAADIFLAPLTVVQARPGLFDAWLASTGKLGGQRKVPRLANDRHIIDPLLALNDTPANNHAGPTSHEKSNTTITEP